jgi:hypothetical protein
VRDKPAGDAPSREAETPVEKLRRWELYGGHWRVDSRASNQIKISLLTCSGGEEADRLLSADPELIAYVGNRGCDQDD